MVGDFADQAPVVESLFPFPAILLTYQTPIQCWPYPVNKGCVRGIEFANRQQDIRTGSGTQCAYTGC